MAAMGFAFFGALRKTKARWLASPRNIVYWMPSKTNAHMRPKPERPCTAGQSMDGPNGLRLGYNNLSANPHGAPRGRVATMRRDRPGPAARQPYHFPGPRARTATGGGGAAKRREWPTDGTGPAVLGRYSAVTQRHRCRLTHHGSNAAATTAMSKPRPAGRPAGRCRGLPAGQVRCDVAIRQAGRVFT